MVMRWLFAKLSSLAGTVVAALAGAAASQTRAFIQAYLQRLGGHVAEARHALATVEGGAAAGAPGDPAAQAQLVAALRQRVDALEDAYRSIDHAAVFAKPVAFLTHMDPEIAAASAASFVPALPLDAPSLVFTLAGMIAGWLLWRGLCWPMAAAWRRRRRRAA